MPVVEARGRFVLPPRVLRGVADTSIEAVARIKVFVVGDQCRFGMVHVADVVLSRKVCAAALGQDRSIWDEGELKEKAVRHQLSILKSRYLDDALVVPKGDEITLKAQVVVQGK